MTKITTIIAFSIIFTLTIGIVSSVPIVYASSVQTVNAEVTFNPNPVIFSESFDIKIIFKNPVTGTVVKDIEYETRINFDDSHDIIQWRTVDTDGVVTQTAIISENCCRDHDFVITVLGIEGRNVATQTINIPIKIELRDVKLEEIPSWVRNNAGWWASGGDTDSSFTQTIEFLMKEGFLDFKTIPDTFPDYLRRDAGFWANGNINDQEFLQILEDFLNPSNKIPSIESETPLQANPSSELEIGSSDNSTQKIPDWVKNTMGWYAEGLISEDEIISAIKFLINEGIIKLD